MTTIRIETKDSTVSIEKKENKGASFERELGELIRACTKGEAPQAVRSVKALLGCDTKKAVEIFDRYRKAA